jgi:hypothetical protein
MIAATHVQFHLGGQTRVARATIDVLTTQSALNFARNLFVSIDHRFIPGCWRGWTRFDAAIILAG